MNSRLEERLQTITDNFVRDLIGAFRVVVEGTLGVGSVRVKRKPGRPAGQTRSAKPGRSSRSGRRSPEETEALARKLATFIGKQPKGIRVEAMGKQLGMKTAELMLPIKKALAAKWIKRTGQKRATTYFASK